MERSRQLEKVCYFSNFNSITIQSMTLQIAEIRENTAGQQ
jgi:hypothetical protein